MNSNEIQLEYIIKVYKVLTISKRELLVKDLQKRSFSIYSETSDMSFMTNESSEVIISISKDRVTLKTYPTKKYDEKIAFLINLVEKIISTINLKIKEYNIEVSIEGKYNHDTNIAEEEKILLLSSLLRQDVLREDFKELHPLLMGIDLYVTINEKPVLLTIINLNEHILIKSNIDLPMAFKFEEMEPIIKDIINSMDNVILTSIKQIGINEEVT